MGYDTNYSGHINITPALSQEEVTSLQKFSNTRRMKREKGPYYVDNGGMAGQDYEDDIIDYNSPPEEQPSLWCNWIVNDEGTQLFWNGMEKFHDDAEWLEYIINHFLGETPIAQQTLSFLKGNYTLNGVILAQGESLDDIRFINVIDNQVNNVKAQVTGRGPISKIDDSTTTNRQIPDVDSGVFCHLNVFDPDNEIKHVNEVGLEVPEALKNITGLSYVEFDIVPESDNGLSIYPSDSYNMVSFYFIVLNMLFNKQSQWYNQDIDFEAFNNVIIDGDIEVREFKGENCYLLHVFENELFWEDAYYLNIIEDKLKDNALSS